MVFIYFVFRNIPFMDIWLALSGLKIWQLMVLLILNFFIYILISLRWWIIVRAQDVRISFSPLFWVRIAVFGVSYFTLGPQVGGEPLQVMVLQRKFGLAFSRATSSVMLDKLLELLVNFILLGLGFVAVLRAGLFAELGIHLNFVNILLIGLIGWPLFHIILLYNKHYPLSFILNALPIVSKKNRLVRFVRVSEWLAGIFCQRHPIALLSSICFSVIAGAGMLLDYSLMMTFLGIRLSLWQIVAGWTVGWLSFLVPLPGGLGVLEASQVFALGIFGVHAGLAISLALLMRARDIFIGSLGLILAGSNITGLKSQLK